VSNSPAAFRAVAPGGIGNIGPGIDILGCAITGLADAVTARFGDADGVLIDESGHPELPRDASRHASGLAALEVLRRSGRREGVRLTVEKNLPLAGGQGGSAASAVAGAVAVNALLGEPLDRAALLACALVAEETLAGRHIDNLAPSLFGGILLIRSIDPLRFDSLPIPPALRIAIVHPEMKLRTRDARAVLPHTVSLETALAQATAVAAMVAAFCSGDLSRLRGAIDDRIAEPARATMLPGFHEAKRAALESGALGCSISGGGPSSFALTDGDATANAVVQQMINAYYECGIAASGRIAQVDAVGARVERVA
jgi:homoserine kinase